MQCGRVSKGDGWAAQVKLGAGAFERKGTSTVVHRRSVRNTTSGKVATMNARANSRHLQNSWKSCMWALFCHLGGLSGRFYSKKIFKKYFEKFIKFPVECVDRCLWATQVLAADLKTVKSQIFNFRIRDLRIRGSEGPILTRPSILLGKVGQKCLCGYPAPVCCFPFCTLF